MYRSRPSGIKRAAATKREGGMRVRADYRGHRPVSVTGRCDFGQELVEIGELGEEVLHSPDLELQAGSRTERHLISGRIEMPSSGDSDRRVDLVARTPVEGLEPHL